MHNSFGIVLSESQSVAARHWDLGELLRGDEERGEEMKRGEERRGEERRREARIGE